MKRFLAAGAVGMGLVAPLGAGASHNEPGGGPRDFAVGAGSSEFFAGAVGNAHFALSSHSDADGLDPSGHVSSYGDPDGPGPLEPFTAKGKITCLRVEGNRASIKWRLDRATGSAAQFTGGGVVSFVEDNGEPRGGQPVDAASTSTPLPAAVFNPTADQCPPPDAAPYDPLEQGNVTVHDAAGP
jgi:hypothetical protein